MRAQVSLDDSDRLVRGVLQIRQSQLAFMASADSTVYTGHS